MKKVGEQKQVVLLEAEAPKSTALAPGQRLSGGRWEAGQAFTPKSLFIFLPFTPTGHGLIQAESFSEGTKSLWTMRDTFKHSMNFHPK